MPGKWDTSMKRLVGENPKHFINWLLPQAQFQGKAEIKTSNLKKCTLPTPSYTWTFPTGDKVHAFWFKIIDLWNIAPETIKQTELVGIFPLLVLTQGGKRPEVVEEVITRIEASGGKSSAELLSQNLRLWKPRHFNGRGGKRRSFFGASVVGNACLLPPLFNGVILEV